MTRSSGFALRLLAPSLGVVLLVGCAGPGQGIMRRDSVAGLYDRATVEYELDASRLSLPLAVTHVEGNFVSYEHVPSHPVPGQTRGKLIIDYPHPAGHTDLALARVEIVSRLPDGEPIAPTPEGWSGVVSRVSSAARETIAGATSDDRVIRESWELAIRKTELDAIVAELNRSGYFDSKARREPGVKVAATLDGSKLRKDWQQTPELDALMLRVRNHGQLIAYQRPPGFKGEKQPPATLAAYREMKARRGFAEAASLDQPHLSWNAGRHGLAAPGAALPPTITRLPDVQSGRRY